MSNKKNKETKKIIDSVNYAKTNFKKSIRDIEKHRKKVDIIIRSLNEEIDKLSKIEDYYSSYPPIFIDDKFIYYGGTIPNSAAQLAKTSERLRHVTLQYLTNIRLSGTASMVIAMNSSFVTLTRGAAEIDDSVSARKLISELREPTPLENQVELGKRLEKIKPSLKDKLDGAWETLYDRTKTDRYRQASSSMRELISDTLQVLAPDSQVISMPWFKPETKNGNPSLRQRARYAIVGSNQEILEELKIIDEVGKNIRDHYEILNKYIHQRDTLKKLDNYLRTLFKETQDYLLNIFEMRDKLFSSK